MNVTMPFELPPLRASGGDNIALIPPPEYASEEKYTNLFK